MLCIAKWRKCTDFCRFLSTKGCISLTIDDAGRLHCCVARVTIVLDVASAAGVLRTTEGACLAFIAVSVNYTTAGGNKLSAY